RGVLEIPSEFAGIDIQSNCRVGVEVVTGARLRIVLRHRVSRAPDGKASCGIIRTRLPDTAATGLPRIVFVLPCLASRIAWFGDYVPSPQFLSRSRFKRSDPAPCAGVSRAVCDDDLVFSGDRRRHEFFFIAELVSGGDHLVPDDFPIVPFDCNDTAIWQVGEDEIFP